MRKAESIDFKHPESLNTKASLVSTADKRKIMVTNGK